MSIYIEVDKVEHQIRDLEFKQKSAQNGLIDLEREMVLLNIKKTALSENIKNLKKNEIIIISIPEFKKSKEELNRAITRMEMVKTEKEKVQRALKSIEEFIAKAYEKLKELKSQEVSNVIPFTRAKS